MSKHFEDARYYLGRAAEHAKAGLREEIEPVEERVRALVGGEDDEPEPSRLDQLQAELKELEAKTEGEAREAIADASERIRRFRAGEAPDSEEETA